MLKILIRKLSLDLGGSILIGMVLGAIFGPWIGIVSGIVAFIFVSRPSIAEYRNLKTQRQ